MNKGELLVLAKILKRIDDPIWKRDIAYKIVGCLKNKETIDEKTLFRIAGV